MISYSDALNIVRSNAFIPETTTTNLENCLSFTLAKDVFSDTDMPPFDKSAVDGYACRREDLSDELICIESIAAGQLPSKVVNHGECMHIMTGCIVPSGADCVIMVEHTEKLPNGKIRFTEKITSNNICYKAEDIKAGQKVLSSGTVLRPPHIAILASVGCTKPEVFEKPCVGIISTGDELVEPYETPGPAQIRNSNALQLIAQVKEAGFNYNYHGIAPDSPQKTLEIIQESLSKNTVTLLTGGVSMGEYDFVPEMMEKAGIKILFKSIAVQPGRPTVFGKTPDNKYCFGLPGNPVSSFVQMHLLCFPLLFTLSGSIYSPNSLKIPLAHDYERKKAVRMGVIPVKINQNGEIEAVEYHGSAHIHAYVNADALMIIKPGTKELKKGDIVDVRLI